MKGELHGRHKIRRVDALTIRQECRPGEHDGPHEMPNSVSGMARKLGISRRQVARILKGGKLVDAEPPPCL